MSSSDKLTSTQDRHRFEICQMLLSSIDNERKVGGLNLFHS